MPPPIPRCLLQWWGSQEMTAGVGVLRQARVARRPGSCGPGKMRLHAGPRPSASLHRAHSGEEPRGSKGLRRRCLGPFLGVPSQALLAETYSLNLPRAAPPPRARKRAGTAPRPRLPAPGGPASNPAARRCDWLRAGEAGRRCSNRRPRREAAPPGGRGRVLACLWYLLRGA